MKKTFNKRGSIEDAVLIMIFLVVIAIFAYPMVEALLAINNGIQGNTDLSTDAKATSQDFTDRLPFILEGIYLLLIIFGYMGAFILAFFIDTHPAFFLLAAIFFTVLIFVIPMLANLWEGAIDTGFENAEAQFTVIPFIMNNFLKITLVMWGMIIVGLYARRSTL